MASRCGEDTASARRADAELTVLRWTNRAYDPTLTIRKHLDTEQTRVSLDLNSPRAGISSGRVGGKLVTLMRSSSAEHGQLWWNRISDSGCVAVQTGLLLLLKVVSRGVLKRRRAPLKKRRRNARSEQKFPFVGTSFWSTILFVGLCSSSPHNFSADVNTINAEYVSVCGQTICLSFTVHGFYTELTWSHFNWPILNEPTF